MAPLVSVVIPTYNRAHCLAGAIDSALGQTHPGVEVLVIDDGSTDGTAALVAGRYRADRRVRYLWQGNAGVAAARNAGLATANGRFIAFLDSDDWWHPWKLEAQLAVLEAFPQAGMVWSEMEAVDSTGRVTHPRYLRRYYGAYRWFPGPEHLFCESRAMAGGVRAYAGDIYSAMITGNLVHTSTALLRRERMEAVGGFNPALAPCGEDYDFHLRTCRLGPVAYLDASTIRYLCDADDRLTRHGRVMATNFLATLTRTMETDRDRIRLPRRLLRQVFADAHRWLGEINLNEGRLEEGRRHYLCSLCHWPWQPRTAAMLALSSLPRAAGEALRGAWQRRPRRA